MNINKDWSKPDVVAVTMQHWAALEALFSTSPGVDGCWCMWPLRAPKSFRPDKTGNRADFEARLRSGMSPGLIAVAEDRAVGWCALGLRLSYPQYPAIDDRSVWAVPCLYIAPSADRAPTAGALIDQAVAIAAANGATALDGPPPWWLPGDAAAIERATRTFLDNGFERIGAGARMPALRRNLN